LIHQLYIILFVFFMGRWQLTKGYRDKAAKTIREIAEINKNPQPKDLEKRLGTKLQQDF